MNLFQLKCERRILGREFRVRSQGIVLIFEPLEKLIKMGEVCWNIWEKTCRSPI